MGRRFEICIDANDPERLRGFWSTALAYEPAVTVDGDVDLRDPGGLGPIVWFQKVPETKTIKNRVHLDIWVDDTDTAAGLVDLLVAEGGTILKRYEHFTVLADPEGNELCINWDSA